MWSRWTPPYKVKDERHSDAVQSGVDDEHRHRRARCQRLDPGREVEDQTEFREDQTEVKKLISDDVLEQRRRAGDNQSHHRRNGQTDKHPTVDFPEKGAGYLGRELGRRPKYRR